MVVSLDEESLDEPDGVKSAASEPEDKVALKPIPVPFEPKYKVYDDGSTEKPLEPW